MGFVSTSRLICFFFVSLAMIGAVTPVRAAVDIDGDGFADAVELQYGYDPTDPRPIKLPKRIEINLKKQELTYFVGEHVVGRHLVSAGAKGWPTPRGEFKILNKSPKAWSKVAGLWMPYWMGFAARGKVGLHELPIWPSGKREGADHLGHPASHGCVRLGIGPAKALYDWADIGTKIMVQ